MSDHVIRGCKAANFRDDVQIPLVVRGWGDAIWQPDRDAAALLGLDGSAQVTDVSCTQPGTHGIGCLTCHPLVPACTDPDCLRCRPATGPARPIADVMAEYMAGRAS